MPAAAVIPAPIAYIKVVAVKKLVVEFWPRTTGPPNGEHWPGAAHLLHGRAALNRVARRCRTFTVKKLECSKQAYA